MRGIRKNKRGVILIAVLGITALAAAIAMELAYHARIEGERVIMTHERSRALLMAESGYLLALEALDYDSFATGPFMMARDEGSVSITIRDESALFPLHTLFDGTGLLNIGAKTRFERLIEMARLSSAVVDPLLDYMDPDDQPFPRGAERGSYLTMTPPRQPANRMLYSLDELEHVYGFDTGSVQTLTSLSRLHGSGFVDINTAPPEVIASLSAEISLDAAKRIADRAQVMRYKTLDEVHDVVPISDAGMAELGSVAQVEPSVFRVISKGSSGSTEVTISTIVERQAGQYAVKYRRME